MMLQDLSLENFLIDPDKWETVCGNREALKKVSDGGSGSPIGLGFHPELGWFVLVSGQGPSLVWNQRGDASKWAGEEFFPKQPWNGAIHADDWFSIGSSHTVCQDYTRAQEGDSSFRALPDMGKLPSCAVVSDGCSSSPDVDFGARFMVVSALWEAATRIPLSPSRVLSGATVAGWGPIKTILDERCLDATLLFAGKRPDGLVQVQAFGDGVIMIRRRNGSLEVYDIDHGGVPAYLSYLSNPGTADRYRTEMAGKLKVKASVDGIPVAVWDIPIPALPGWPEFSFTVDPADADLVVLMTDGVHSFQDISGLAPVPVPLEAVLSHIVGFKNMTGAFVGRRLHAFETKECPKLGWRHYDDLGVAALWMEEEKR